jgi:uncharacterized protein DUF3631
MPKLTPAERFHNIFKQWISGATEAVRAEAEKKADQWLAKNGKTRADISSVIAQAVKDEAARQPPPPPSDPRDSAAVRFDPDRHNPASLVESIISAYVTMAEHVRVIYVLWIVLTHVYTKFSVVPRIALVSEHPDCGKSTALELARYLTRRPNEEALGTGAAVRDHLDRGPGTVLLDELDHADKEAQQRLRQIWDIGHKRRGSKISLMIGGKKKLFDLYAPMMAAGVGLLRNFLGSQQQSRAHMLEMERCTEETMPPRNFYIPDELDEKALNSVYSLLHRWAATAKLNPKPSMPAGVITRYADNVRGLLSVADNCGADWGQRARTALMVLLEKEKTERPEVLILRHALLIIDTLELDPIPSRVINRELLRLDQPDARWNQYRGFSGGDYAHALRPDEQAALLKLSGIEAKPMRPSGGGKLFRGYRREWIVEALRKHEKKPAPPPLRLITPALGLSLGLATSPVLVTAFSQVPPSVVGAGLPGLVLVCGAVVALARRRRRLITPRVNGA